MVPGTVAGGNIYTTLDFSAGPTTIVVDANYQTGYFNDDYSKVAGRDQDANLGLKVQCRCVKGKMAFEIRLNAMHALYGRFGAQIDIHASAGIGCHAFDWAILK